MLFLKHCVKKVMDGVFWCNLNGLKYFVWQGSRALSGETFSFLEMTGRSENQLIVLFCFPCGVGIQRSIEVQKRLDLATIEKINASRFHCFQPRQLIKISYTPAFWSSIFRLRSCINITQIEHKCLQSKIVKTICGSKIKWVIKSQSCFIWIKMVEHSQQFKLEWFMVTDLVSPGMGWGSNWKNQGRRRRATTATAAIYLMVIGSLSIPSIRGESP